MVHGQIRASDAERDAVAARLHAAAAEGRLEPDELDERVGVALAARTRGELARLVADLPRSARRARPQRTRGRAAAAFAAGNCALVVLWMADVGAHDPLIVGDSDFFWPIVPLAGWALATLWRRLPRLTA